MKVNINGLNIHYEKSGQGKPLVLLHGWGCDTKIFKALNAHFQQYFTVYRLDFPGFGTSDLPPIPWTNDDYVDFTKAFLEQLTKNQVSIIGMGQGKLRIVTHLDYTDAMHEHFLKVLKSIG